MMFLTGFTILFRTTFTFYDYVFEYYNEFSSQSVLKISGINLCVVIRIEICILLCLQVFRDAK